MKFTDKILIGLTFLLFTARTNGQTDSLIKSSGQNLPTITEFYNTLGQDIDEISNLLFKHGFSISDAVAQEKANQTCCPDINYKEKKFFAKYYSNGKTDVQLIFRNDNKLFSVELIFPDKNIKYMQTAEAELKTLRFQVSESKRNPKQKSTYKQFKNNGIPTRRAFTYYFDFDKPDKIIVDDWKLVNDK